MRFISIFFNPPPMPDLELPLAARLLPHARMSIQKACEFFYFRGVAEGIVFGVLVTLLLQSALRSNKGGRHDQDLA